MATGEQALAAPAKHANSTLWIALDRSTAGIVIYLRNIRNKRVFYIIYIHSQHEWFYKMLVRLHVINSHKYWFDSSSYTILLRFYAFIRL